jgi:hypothetical protein
MADRYQLDPKWLRPAAALALFRSLSSSTNSGRREISFEIRRALSLISLASETTMHYVAGHRHAPWWSTTSQHGAEQWQIGSSSSAFELLRLNRPLTPKSNFLCQP